jgi:hypothetical protein
VELAELGNTPAVAFVLRGINDAVEFDERVGTTLPVRENEVTVGVGVCDASSDCWAEVINPSCRSNNWGLADMGEHDEHCKTNRQLNNLPIRMTVEDIKDGGQKRPGN